MKRLERCREVIAVLVPQGFCDVGDAFVAVAQARGSQDHPVVP